MGIFDNVKAFAPMFDTPLELTAKRGDRVLRGTFMASISPCSEDDPFSEAAAESNRKRYSVLILRRVAHSWMAAAFDGEEPQIGDVLSLTNGKKMAITKVNNLVDDWYELEAREC